jgi:hypothetical protein
MSHDDLSSAENQRPPGRGRPTWIISLNVAVGLAAVAIFAEVALIPHHGPESPTSGAAADMTVPAEATSAVASAAPAHEASAGAQFSFDGASQDQCSAKGTIESVSLGSRVPFTFDNESPVPVQVIWLNYQGGSVPYATLAPGGTYSVNTTIGNVWMIATTAQSCLGIFSVLGTGHISVA